MLLAEPSLQGGNTCAATAAAINMSCAPPPDPVTVSWLLQSVDAIQDVNQIATLNTVIQVFWRDWRLAYTEGGFGCWAVTTAVAPSTTAVAAALAAAFQTALLGLWGCASATNCAGSTLPPGVLPSASVNATTGVVTAFPAPLDWQRACATVTNNGAALAANPILASLTGTPCSSGLMTTDYTTALLAAGAPAPPAGAPPQVWLPLAVSCTGAGARRLPSNLRLNTMQAQGSPPTGFGGPGGGPSGFPGGPSFPAGTSIDYSTLWDPALDDSMNQEAPDTPLEEEWTLYPDGSIRHSLHFQADYAMTGSHLVNFPFDTPMVVATRRPFGIYTDELLLQVGDSGFALPQEMDGWTAESTGVAICYSRDVGVADDPGATPTDCNTPGAAPCTQVVVLWLQLRRSSSYWLQNMLAPITLITVLSAATYYNDLDAYDSRMTIMATSLLSLMALSGFVSASLPPTEIITFIHFALYTAYALMGWGIGVVILVSFCLSADLDHAKKIRAPGAAPTAPSPGGLSHSSSMHGRLMRRVRRVASQEEEMRIKPWVMRLYYHDALIYRRLKEGKGTPEDCEAPLVYFHAAELQAARLLEKRGELTLAISGALSGDDDVMEAPRRSEGQGPRQSEVEREESGYCPTYIYLRIAIIEMDCAMRVLHLFIYGIVLLARYVQIMNDATGDFDCNKLVSYFAVAG